MKNIYPKYSYFWITLLLCHLLAPNSFSKLLPLLENGNGSPTNIPRTRHKGNTAKTRIEEKPSTAPSVVKGLSLLNPTKYSVIPTGLERNLAPDVFFFSIVSNKDSVSIGDDFEITVKVNWVDYSYGNGIHFLPEWYKYTLKVVLPEGFIQIGGDYHDYCSKPVDAQNPLATFTIKGHFEYAPEKPIFKVLRGFEGANEYSEFIWKGEKGITIIKNSIELISKVQTTLSSKRIDATTTISSEINCSDIPKASVSDCFVDCIHKNTLLRNFDNSCGLSIEQEADCANTKSVRFKILFKNISLTNLRQAKILLHGSVNNSDCVSWSEMKSKHFVTEAFACGVGQCKEQNLTVSLDGFDLNRNEKVHAHIFFTQVNDIHYYNLALREYNFSLLNKVTITRKDNVLTASTCLNGEITWNTNAKGPTLNIDSSKVGIYKAKCCDGDWSNEITICPASVKPTIVASSTNIVKGEDVTLTATGCLMEYKWSNGESGNPITVTPLNTQSFIVNCPLNVCPTNSVPIEIKVSDCSNTVAPSISSTKTKIVIGEAVTLTAIGCEGTVKWITGATGTTLTVSPTVSQAYTAKCVIGQCESTASNTITVNVCSPPSAPTGNISGTLSGVICGTTNTFTLTSGGCSNYYWTYKKNGEENESYFEGSILTLGAPWKGEVKVYCGTKACYSTTNKQASVDVTYIYSSITLTATSHNLWKQNGTNSISLFLEGCPLGIIPELYKNNSKVEKSSVLEKDKIKWTISDATDKGDYYAKCSCKSSEWVKILYDNRCPDLTAPYFKRDDGTVITSIRDYTGKEIKVMMGCQTGVPSWNGTAPPKDGNYYKIRVPSSYEAQCSTADCQVPTKIEAFSVNCDASIPTFTYSSSRVTSGTSVTITGSCAVGSFSWNNGATNLSRTEIITLANRSFDAKCTVSSGCLSDGTASVDVGCDAPAPTFEYSPNTLLINEGQTIWVKGKCNAQSTFQWNDGVQSNERWLTPSDNISVSGKCISNNYTNCSDDASLNIAVNKRVAISLNLAKRNAICVNGKCDGIITANVLNRGGGYTYSYWLYRYERTSWVSQLYKNSSGAVVSSQSDRGTNLVFAELPQGKYKVVVRDYAYAGNDSRDGVEDIIDVEETVCPTSANFGITSSGYCIPEAGNVTLTVTGCNDGTVVWWRDIDAGSGSWVSGFNPANVTQAGRYKAVCETAECPHTRNEKAFSNAIEIFVPEQNKPLVVAVNNTTTTFAPDLSYNFCVTDASGNVRGCEEKSIYYKYNSAGVIEGITDPMQLLAQGLGFFAYNDPNLKMPSAAKIYYKLGETVTLMGNGCPSGTYTWSNGQTGNTITIQPTQTTPIFVYCNTGNCRSAISNLITLEKTSGTFDVATSSNVVCSAKPTATLTAKGCANGLTIKWFKKGVDGNFATGVTHTFTPLATSEYFARCYDGNTILLESKPLKITLGSEFVISAVSYNTNLLNFSNNTTTIRPCVNSDVILEAAGCQGVVRWATKIGNANGGYQSNGQNINYSASLSSQGTDYVDLPGKSGFSTLVRRFTTNETIYVGCAGVNPATGEYLCTSNWQAINVVLKSKSTTQPFQLEAEVCENTPLVLKVNPTVGNTDQMYIWKKQDLSGTLFEYDFRPKVLTNVNGGIIELPISSPVNIAEAAPDFSTNWQLDVVNECGVASYPFKIKVIQPPSVALFEYTANVKNVRFKNRSIVVFKSYSSTKANVDDTRDARLTVNKIDTKATWTFRKVNADGSKSNPIYTFEQTLLAKDSDWSPFNYEFPELGVYEVTVGLRDINTRCPISFSQIIELKCTAPAAPVKPFNADKFVCVGTTSTTLSVSGCTEAGNLVKWYNFNVNDPNADNASIATGASLTIATNTLAIGNYVYRAKCVQNLCESSFSEKFNLVVGTNPTPVANAINPATGISSQTLVSAIENRQVSLSATGCEYGTVRWFKQGTTAVLATGNPVSVSKVLLGNQLNTETSIYAQCTSGVIPNTCTSANSNIIKVKFIACPSISPITLNPNITTGCSSIILGANGGDDLYTWKSTASNIALATGKTFQAQLSGTYFYESCGLRSANVSITINTVKGAVDGPVIVGTAINARELLGGGTPTYQWRSSADATTTVISTVNPYTPAVGKYYVWVNKGGCIDGPFATEAYAQGPNCTLNFKAAEQGVAITCEGMAKITLAHNLTSVPAGAIIEYRLDLGEWQADNVFTDVPYGKHTVSVRLTNGSQVCYAVRSIAETAFDACGKLACDDLYIAGTDEQGNETATLPRDPATKGVKPLRLSVQSFVGDPLTGVTYRWERISQTTTANGFSSTQATISVSSVGTYKVTISRGTTTCSTSITIGASPCNTTPDPANRVCNTSTLTAVADEVSNRLTDLSVGDVVQAGDFNITITEVSGTSSGWNGKGYVIVPYLNAQVNVVLKNAVFNDCSQLTNANVVPDQPTVYTEYDPSWGSVVDVEDQILNIKNSIVELSDLIKTYTGTPEEKAKIDGLIQKISAGKDNPNLIPELKIDFENKVNLINSTWNETKNCTSSSLPAGRLQAMSLTQEVCNINTLVALVDEIQNLNLEPQNLSFPELNIPSRCNTDILTYWKNVLQLKTTTPEQYSDPTGFNWNITQYTLYDTNWKTNKKWWWIKEVCSPDNCANKQMYVYSPKYKDYILFYDKQADCDGNMQALIDLADGIGNTYSFVLGTMLGGPEDLAFEYGAITVKYLGTTLNIAQKTAKAKNIAKAVTIYVKESKLAKAAGKKVDDIKTWWGKLLKSTKKIIGTIVRDGNKLTYNNPSGKVISWTEQGIKGIESAIQNAKKLDPSDIKNRGKLAEAKVGEFVKSKKELYGYGLNIKPSVTDLDVTTLDEIIEVKAGFGSIKEEQFKKLLDINDPNFCNPYNKRVILFVDKSLADATPAEVRMLERITKQGVTIVANSLEELGSILK